MRLELIAQTCCSGGVPLSSNLGLPPSAANVLQTALSYDLNVLQTLKSGSSILADDSRSRRTHSVMFELGYAFGERFSVDGFFSWVRQEREINQFGNRDFTSTQGVGDAVILFKYRALHLHQGRTILNTAIGAKMPLGASDLRRPDGLSIVADLQPGSGAWDGILWAQLFHDLDFRPTMSLSATVSLALKGKNDDYLIDQTYQFGNEVQIMSGISDRLLIGNLLFDPALIFRFRAVAEDRINGQTVPGTGGRWMFVNPGLSYWLTPDLSWNANMEVPLYAFVQGTQVSPTIRINTGLFLRIPTRSKQEELVIPIN